jgi:hypothetical protein
MVLSVWLPTRFTQTTAAATAEITVIDEVTVFLGVGAVPCPAAATAKVTVIDEVTVFLESCRSVSDSPPDSLRLLMLLL